MFTWNFYAGNKSVILKDVGNLIIKYQRLNQMHQMRWNKSEIELIFVLTVVYLNIQKYFIQPLLSVLCHTMFTMVKFVSSCC